ncbi:hypothetical protein QF038_000782 [Pseudarthrobacter sp. W1I19]|uniref:RNA-binding protein n=1 Tax=Pseudarthrobacter sp. W1I19 TaxID=3042288 RepID=UPI002788644A|nr:RNA-binding protein [Pseudarthrobacter sp. W1I19]MDQ0922274.1 hypothetical protein [Pseudarthrobacter sp. W1I19]
MALIYPMDLQAWRAWQGRQNRLRKLRAGMRPAATPTALLAVRGASPRVLVALDAPTPTQLASLLKPLELLGNVDAAVLLPGRMSHLLQGDWTWSRVSAELVPEELSTVRVVLGVGHYLPIGGLAELYGQQVQAQFLVVQHGLLTPHAPPLPGNSLLLAFSEQDAQYAISKRSDVAHTVVGSQLLWDAAGDAKIGVVSDQPVFLGQLHGAELPRPGKARTTSMFCRSTGALYRPHPAETDILSRAQHAYWERRGLSIDRAGGPLRELTQPVVSIFSTGVLEAAVRGLPAWVTYHNPPPWLEEFWERYSLSQWGRDATLPPVQPAVEPAVAIARIVKNLIGESP